MTVSFEDAPTQVVFRTDQGFVDWARASASAQAIVCGNPQPDNYVLLHALFRTAFARGAELQTEVGPFTAVRARRLLDRCHQNTTVADIDTLWCLLFKLFMLNASWTRPVVRK